MDKLLTVAVPAYNAAQYLEKCLDSLLCPDLDRLDVVVVNDGSADGTLELARRYAARYPQSIRVIDKPNGGHGSGINAAAAQALGKYFRVLDADDWFITSNIAPLLRALENTEADIVLTHYHKVDMATGAAEPFCTSGLPLGVPCTLQQMMDAGALACCVFHGVCYRTAFYRRCGLVLPEKVFYEDQEYATVPFRDAQSLLPLDLFLYEYMIGNADQSVSDQNQVRRVWMMETVLERILRQRTPGMAPAAKAYFDFKLREMLLSTYSIMLIKNTDRPTGLAQAKKLRQRLQSQAPDLYAATARQYNTALLLHRLGFTGDTLRRLGANGLYRRLRAMMH